MKIIRNYDKMSSCQVVMSVIWPMVSRIRPMISVLWSVMSGIGTVWNKARTWPVLSKIGPVRGLPFL